MCSFLRFFKNLVSKFCKGKCTPPKTDGFDAQNSLILDKTNEPSIDEVPLQAQRKIAKQEHPEVNIQMSLWSPSDVQDPPPIKTVVKTVKSLPQRTLEQQKRATEIGERGERTSSYFALPIAAYGKQLRNLYIPKLSTGDTEIDTLVISVGGIFVMETKNYRGWICGDEDWQNWTVSYSKTKKFALYNPIRQNATHIRALRALLPELSENCFFSFIIFGDSCEFKRMSYRSPRVYVMKHCELNQHFNGLLRECNNLLTREQVNEIFMKLKQYTNVSEETKLRHIEQVQYIKAHPEKYHS